MQSVTEDMDAPDLTTSELALVSAHEKAGLVSQLACHFCGLQFDVKKTRSLRAHIEEVHVLGDSGYMCGVCCEEFTSRKAVETHMSTFHRAPKPLGCGTCGETFRVRNLLLRHIDSHTKGELDNNKVGLCYCGECFLFFDSVMSLQIHTMTHREQPVFVCGACGLQSQHRHVMVKHLETHVISNLLNAAGKEHAIHELEPVEVDAASVEEKAIEKYDDSEMTHVLSEEVAAKEEETSYRCGVCYASFVNLNNALSHAETHQGDQTQLVKDLDSVELSVLMQEGSENTEHIEIQNEMETNAE